MYKCLQYFSSVVSNKIMPEIIIQSDGSFLVPRGEDNQFYLDLFQNIVDESNNVALSDFFRATENSEQIFGKQGLCG